jgi:hypothetical protein
MRLSTSRNTRQQGQTPSDMERNISDKINIIELFLHEFAGAIGSKKQFLHFSSSTTNNSVSPVDTLGDTSEGTIISFSGNSEGIFEGTDILWNL